MKIHSCHLKMGWQGGLCRKELQSFFLSSEAFSHTKVRDGVRKGRKVSNPRLLLQKNFYRSILILGFTFYIYCQFWHGITAIHLFDVVLFDCARFSELCNPQPLIHTWSGYFEGNAYNIEKGNPGTLFS